MKLSERYIDRYYDSNGWEGYILMRNLEDLLEIVRFETLMEGNEKDQLWYDCEDYLKQIAAKHNLQYD